MILLVIKSHVNQVPHMNTQSGDKYDPELTFKHKQRNVINSDKNNDTFSDKITHKPEVPHMSTQSGNK